MSHSVFTGRVVGDREPLFLREDTDAAIALAEEEADTCPQCGFLRVWCRDAANQFGVFEARGEQCHATYATALHRHRSDGREDAVAAATRDSIQVAPRFREGREPDLLAGLDLAVDPDGEADD